MGFEDEEYTCDRFPGVLSPYVARELAAVHRLHGCAADTESQAVIAGANNDGWDEADQLATAADWAAAYQARHLAAGIGADGQVHLVTGDRITAIAVPHSLAAVVVDRCGFPTPVLAPPLERISVQPWLFLAGPGIFPADVLEELARLDVHVLDPGQRVELPATARPHAEGRRWWHQWPRTHYRYSHLMQLAPAWVLLNQCFYAAAGRTPHFLQRPGRQWTLGVQAYDQFTVVVDAAAAAGIRARRATMDTNRAASQLIAAGARVLDAAGSRGEVVVRHPDGTETTVQLSDLVHP